MVLNLLLDDNMFSTIIGTNTSINPYGKIYSHK